jgi:hypothetical protein
MKILNAEQVRAIQAYVLLRAGESSNGGDRWFSAGRAAGPG